MKRFLTLVSISGFSVHTPAGAESQKVCSALHAGQSVCYFKVCAIGLMFVFVFFFFFFFSSSSSSYSRFFFFSCNTNSNIPIVFCNLMVVGGGGIFAWSDYSGLFFIHLGPLVSLQLHMYVLREFWWPWPISKVTIGVKIRRRKMCKLTLNFAYLVVAVNYSDIAQQYGWLSVALRPQKT